MKVDSKILETVYSCAKLGKSEAEIALIINVTEMDLQKELLDVTSEVSIQYRKGFEEGNYLIEKALQEKAEAGDVKAAKELRIRKEEDEIRRLKKKLFNI